MYEQIEGSRALAQTIARCRPNVIAAYPITPQTHIVEGLGVMVKEGSLADCEFLTVESEFASMSASLGASAAGARAYTATASQGLLYMAEVLYNVSGLGLPVVLTVANRAIGAPINIWNDQSDSMSQRDCGWVQVYADDNQAAVGLHVVAFRLAELLSLPVMVCVDGFVLTHAVEGIEVPDQASVDAFLPPFTPRQLLDPDAPVTIGAMVGPEAFTEVRAIAHRTLLRAVDVFDDLTERYAQLTGHRLSAVTPYRAQHARTVLLTIGSVTGTAHELADELAAEGRDVGVVSLTLFRPFPAAAVRDALRNADEVIVVERAFAPGAGGVVTPDVRAALTGLPITVRTVIAGLGGRPVTKDSLRTVLDDAAAGRLEDLRFLDLHEDVVDAALAAGGLS
jgi:pyruvate ferredoxin oxidoreductase alpha subunit